MVGVPVADVGPFFEQDPVESFDFAVGLRPERSSELRGDPGVFERGSPDSRSVARPVVGDHTLKSDAEPVEERVRSFPELDSGDGLFVVVDLGIDDPGSVIERCV